MGLAKLGANLTKLVEEPRFIIMLEEGALQTFDMSGFVSFSVLVNKNRTILVDFCVLLRVPYHTTIHLPNLGSFVF